MFKTSSASSTSRAYKADEQNITLKLEKKNKNHRTSIYFQNIHRSYNVRELTSAGRVADQSIHELAYPRVVQLPR